MTTTRPPTAARAASLHFAARLVGAASLFVAFASLAQQAPPAGGAPTQPASTQRAPAAPGAGAGAASTSSAGGEGADAGARLAQQGAPERGVAACASCHGAQGEGMAAGGFPRLAAQSPDYLARQLRSYADGSRNNPVMTPIAKGLSDGQITAVAAHYGNLKPSSSSSSPSTAKAAAAAPVASRSSPAAGRGAPGSGQARGERLASLGDESIQVQACANCHGAAGVGEPPAYPYLAGQHASYLTTALAEWKSGNRKTDPSGQMPLIAQRLSDADVAALAGYYAAQAAPGPRLQSPEARRPGGAPAMAASSSTPSAGGGAAPPAGAAGQGVGTEAGAPVTGGSQTPGGSGTTGAVNPTTGGGSAPRR